MILRLGRRHACDDGALVDLTGRAEADQRELGKDFGWARSTASTMRRRESV